MKMENIKKVISSDLGLGSKFSSKRVKIDGNLIIYSSKRGEDRKYMIYKCELFQENIALQKKQNDKIKLLSFFKRMFKKNVHEKRRLKKLGVRGYAKTKYTRSLERIALRYNHSTTEVKHISLMDVYFGDLRNTIYKGV